MVNMCSLSHIRWASCASRGAAPFKLSSGFDGETGPQSTHNTHNRHVSTILCHGKVFLFFLHIWFLCVNCSVLPGFLFIKQFIWIIQHKTPIVTGGVVFSSEVPLYSCVVKPSALLQGALFTRLASLPLNRHAGNVSVIVTTEKWRNLASSPRQGSHLC